jgi:uncharacterized membrane protein YdjX (TVP38/TMEM64 family)
VTDVVLGTSRVERDRLTVWARRVAVVAVWVAAIIGWQAYQSSRGLSTIEAAQQFVDTVGRAWWGVLAYVAVNLVRPVVLFPASVLTVVGGLLFGPVVGVAVVVVAANASALVAFGIGRSLGRTPGGEEERTDAGESIARSWSRRMREHSFETVLIMRLVFVPYDVVSYLSGVLRLRPGSFLVATALGSLPGTVSFVLLGASLDRIDDGLGGVDPLTLGAGIFVFVVSIVVARLLRRRRPVDDVNAADPPTVPAADPPTVPSP